MTSELQHTAQRTWHRFLETYEPLRTDLYRYCRYLTRSPWDAEDLAQDALARAFVTLAQMSEDPQHPRAWLFRVASNLWIDHAELLLALAAELELPVRVNGHRWWRDAEANSRAPHAGARKG